MRLVRSTTALCCIVLVLLAGCSGVPGLGGGGGGGGDAYTAPGEPLNASALQADHTGNLREAGSFTVTINGTSALGNDTTDQQTLVRADLEANRTFQRSDVAQSIGGQASGGTQTVYVEGETVYVRLSFGSGNETQTQYQVVNTSGQPTQGRASSEQFVTLDQYFSIIGGTNWTQQGTESYEGTTVTRYTANGSEAFNASALGTSGAPTPNVTDFEATLLVTTDGTVRKLAFTLEATARGQPLTVTNDLEISDVGSTTVEAPDWLDEARNASTNRSNPQGDVAPPA